MSEFNEKMDGCFYVYGCSSSDRFLKSLKKLVCQGFWGILYTTFCVKNSYYIMRYFNRLYVLLFCLLSFISLKAKATEAPSTDLAVVLHEQSINKMLKVIGDISGSSQYEMMHIKGNYNWSVINPHIILKPGKSCFVTDVRIHTGGLDYTTSVTGDMSIWYDVHTNNINVKLDKAIMGIYTKILGRKVHITDVDLADHFTEVFSFEGPLTTMSTDMSFHMPDGSTRTIYAYPSDADLTVINHGVEVVCEMEFSDRPKKPDNINFLPMM